MRVYHDGREYRRKAGRSKALARKVYEKLRTEINEGRFFPKQHRRAVLFDDLLAEYREIKRREHKAVMASEAGYQRLLEQFGGSRIEKVSAAEIDQWRDTMSETMSPATVNLHLTILRATLRLAVRNRRIEASALPPITPLKVNNVHVRYLTDDEERRLLEAAPEWLKPLIKVAIHTGMRRGELLRLRWDEVDFVSGTIFVRTSKSGEGRRIPLSPTAHRTLSTLRDARRERMRARVVAQSEAAGTVFTAPEGGFMLNLGRAWYPVLTRAGVEGLRFHDLRHTFASRLAMRGVDLYRVQILMGHKTQAMTLRYAHLSPDHLRAAVAMLDAPGPKPWAAAALASNDGE